MKQQAFIGLGSNLGQPLEQLEAACIALDQVPETQLVKRSPWYGSHAVGPGEQPDYVNGVAEISTRLTPTALLTALQAIETRYGRLRTTRWAARTLDLDLLWFDGQSVRLPELEIPHPRISERNFVLFPFRDIAPHICLDGKHSVADLAAKLNDQGIWALADT